MAEFSHALSVVGPNVIRLCIWLLLLSVIFVPLERYFALHRRWIARNGLLVDLAYYFISSLIPGIILAFPLSLVAWIVHGLLPAGFVSAVAGLPTWARACAALVVGEIGFYWGHRWSHEIPILWRFHAVHHSAQDLDFLVNTRAHPVDIIFTRLCGLALLYATGLASPLNNTGNAFALLLVVVGTVWGFFIHANISWRLGPLEQIVTTPAFHHWHHTLADHTDRNYASMLPWLDRIFGTFHLPSGQWPAAYGVDRAMPSSLLGQLVDPLVPQRAGAPNPPMQTGEPMTERAR